MCYEDIKIGRNTQSSQADFTLSGASQGLIPADQYRTTLILCPPSASTVWWSINPTAVVGVGIPTVASGSPVVLDIQQHGDLVRRAWTCIPAAGTPTVSWFASSYPFGDRIPNAPK